MPNQSREIRQVRIDVPLRSSCAYLYVDALVTALGRWWVVLYEDLLRLAPAEGLWRFEPVQEKYWMRPVLDDDARHRLAARLRTAPPDIVAGHQTLRRAVELTHEQERSLEMMFFAADPASESAFAGNARLLVGDDWSDDKNNEWRIETASVEILYRALGRLDASAFTLLTIHGDARRRLVVGGGAGRYAIHESHDDEVSWTLVRDRPMDGLMTLNVGGVEREYPAAEIADLETARVASATYLLHGSRDATLRWHRCPPTDSQG